MDIQNTAFIRQILQVVFGLSKKTIDGVIREIHNNGESAAIKTYRVRQRLGPQSMRLLRYGMDAARTGAVQQDDELDTGDPAENDAGDVDDSRHPLSHQRNNTASTSVEQPDAAVSAKDKQTTESSKTNKNMIIKEFMVDVDPNDPGELQRIQSMIKQAQEPNGEERIAQQLVDKTNQERDQARSGNEPIDKLNRRIYALKQELAKLYRRKASLQRYDDEQKQQDS